MQQQHRIEGNHPVVGTGGPAALSQVSEYEQKLLAMNFIGVDAQGRYCFRFTDQPLRTIIGDFSDLCDWRDAQQRQAARLADEQDQINRQLSRAGVGGA